MQSQVNEIYHRFLVLEKGKGLRYEMFWTSTIVEHLMDQYKTVIYAPMCFNILENQQIRYYQVWIDNRCQNWNWKLHEFIILFIVVTTALTVTVLHYILEISLNECLLCVEHFKYLLFNVGDKIVLIGILKF